ncbi:5'-nucleotidase [Allocatelliglobosispora scoriae]|uniref:5'-nucleotidase n=1 Tax=Allocatelliglobosispora scoriae TaxID=643052 RepID=A0A841BJ47_9ACTN|nr:bifunctional metallophosphatase/5'-nucleotidase [Allocatelliglobosispora scoriae]MBB5866802.1 5'-nucleotidase [Allocatelliglobosispora scoriae]
MIFSRMNRPLLATGAALVAFAVLQPASASAAPNWRTAVQILAVNDLHGNLDAVPGAAGSVIKTDAAGNQVSVQAGGVARMATLLDAARQGQGRTLTVGVGDMIGGSPLLSAAYHDEPTVHAMELMGFNVSSVGNHEFDEGRKELKRIVDGGCHPVDGCAEPGVRYPGAKFPYLAANVVDTKTKKPILAPYWIKKYAAFKVGFIGLVTRDVPNVVVRDGIKGLEFRDEVSTIDKYAKELKKKGINAIVVIIHEGGATSSPVYNFNCDAGGPGAGLTGAIKDIAKRTTPLVDLFITGHSHEAYVCNVPDPAGNRRLVTQAASFGRTFTDIRFDMNLKTRDIVRSSVSAANNIVTLDTAEQSPVMQLVETWRARSAAVANKPIGYISADLPGRGSTLPETPLGDVIADSQVFGTRSAGAELAFLNPGGMRADLVYRASGTEGDGVVTFGEAFQVQPFDNILVTMTLTGTQLINVLREQYSGKNEAFPRVLQLSSALRYTVDLGRAGGDRVLADTVRVNGQPVDPARGYRVTANTFLAAGGNDFPTFVAGTDRVNGGIDLAAFVDYFAANSSPGTPLPKPTADRITFLPKP